MFIYLCMLLYYVCVWYLFRHILLHYVVEIAILWKHAELQQTHLIYGFVHCYFAYSRKN
jgi:hypothetical protein